MKMEIPVVAPEAGTIASIDVAVGDAVEPGGFYKWNIFQIHWETS